jgi:hypothetical protein
MRKDMKNLLAVLVGIMLAGAAEAQDKVQVFILAGQSNMQGKGWHDDRTPGNGIDENGTLRKLIDNDPGGAYDYLLDGSSNWITRSDVNIFTVDGDRSGGLSVGYGTDSTMIGPEMGFGWQVGDAYSQDVLIIKTAWGGKSLVTDFRPPSAVRSRGGETGFYYNEILSTVSGVLGDIGSYVPGYAGQGYDLKGFGWHQGWNDRVNQTATDEYEANMVDFIHDIRFDLGAAELPFVVANTGIGGFAETNPRALALMQAQMNVGNAALYPEFAGNVTSINTQGLWRDPSISPITSGNQGFHWNQNGETMFLMGDEMGQEMAAMSGYVPFRQAYLEVNQQTGEIKIVNPSDNLGAFDLEAYQISSADGALNPAGWTAIAGHYDGAGDGSVDAGNWTLDPTVSFTHLGEYADEGGADGSIAIGSEVSLGVGAWIQNLNPDLHATYTDLGGNVKTLYILYTGNENIAADLNFDGSIDIADWGIFITNAQADMLGLTEPQAYQMGDLDGDLDNDIRDYILFRNAFELANPEMYAFETMLAEYNAVPEPGSLMILAGVAGLLTNRRRQTTFVTDRRGN